MDIMSFAAILAKLLVAFALCAIVFKTSTAFFEAFGYDEIDDEIDVIEGKF